MPKYSECPASKMVSFRVNDKEKAFLNDLAQEKGLNLSNYMRRILALLEENSGRAEQLQKWI